MPLPLSLCHHKNNLSAFFRPAQSRYKRGNESASKEDGHTDAVNSHPSSPARCSASPKVFRFLLSWFLLYLKGIDLEFNLIQVAYFQAVNFYPQLRTSINHR
jgi:hypothetical protein